jgi:hypothetical protein
MWGRKKIPPPDMPKLAVKSVLLGNLQKQQALKVCIHKAFSIFQQKQIHFFHFQNFLCKKCKRSYPSCHLTILISVNLKITSKTQFKAKIFGNLRLQCYTEEL